MKDNDKEYELMEMVKDSYEIMKERHQEQMIIGEC
jgi:hypothetical protein